MAVMGIEVAKADAERVRKFLAQNSLIRHGYAPAKTPTTIIFSTVKIPPKSLAAIKKISKSARAVSKNFLKNEQRPRTLKDALKGKLSPREMKSLQSSFDLLGDVAVIEVPEELSGREKIIGEALLQVN